MSTSATTEDSTPATSINSLPLEIKTLIVKLAELQDENYKERNWSNCEEVSELTRKVSKVNEWRGKSLNALFEVNKEWSDLAAVHIFETITWKHDVSLPFFKLIVFPIRVQFFRQIHLFGDGDLSDRLSVCLLSPTITCLYVTGEIIKALFGDLISPGISGTIEQNLQWGAFLALKLKITKVKLPFVNSLQAQTILEALPALTEIDLGIGMGGEEEVMHKLGVQLAQYSSIKTLRITFYAGLIPDSWIDLEWKSTSSLRGLSLTTSRDKNASQFNQTCLDFITKFKSTLERLCIVNYIPSLSSTLIPSTTFPNLAFLDLTVKDEHLAHFCELFPSSPIVSLRFKTSHAIPSKTTLDRALVKYILKYPLLRELEFCDQFLQPEALLEVEMSAIHRQIMIKHSNRARKSCHDLAWLATDHDSFAYRRPLLDEAFHYGKLRLVELERDDDAEGLKEMFENCKWLRANAAEMKD